MKNALKTCFCGAAAAVGEELCTVHLIEREEDLRALKLLDAHYSDLTDVPELLSNPYSEE